MKEYISAANFEYEIYRNSQAIILEIVAIGTIVPGKRGSNSDSYSEEREVDIISAIGNTMNYVNDLSNEEIKGINDFVIEIVRKEYGL